MSKSVIIFGAVYGNRTHITCFEGRSNSLYTKTAMLGTQMRTLNFNYTDFFSKNQINLHYPQPQRWADCFVAPSNGVPRDASCNHRR